MFITAEDIKFGKPNPEPYLLGAERLGLSAPECVVVEDAPAGIIAGLEAGSAVVAVNPPADAPRLSEVALQVENLQPLHISKQLDGYFSVTLRA